jgi:hypothetical protein
MLVIELTWAELVDFPDSSENSRKSEASFLVICLGFRAECSMFGLEIAVPASSACSGPPGNRRVRKELGSDTPGGRVLELRIFGFRSR